MIRLRTISKPKKLFVGTGLENRTGESDDVTYFRNKNIIYQLCINELLQYAGLCTYTRRAGEWIELGSVFFQNTSDFKDMNIKKSFFEYAHVNQAKILDNYCY